MLCALPALAVSSNAENTPKSKASALPKVSIQEVWKYWFVPRGGEIVPSPLFPNHRTFTNIHSALCLALVKRMAEGHENQTKKKVVDLFFCSTVDVTSLKELPLFCCRHRLWFSLLSAENNEDLDVTFLGKYDTCPGKTLVTLVRASALVNKPLSRNGTALFRVTRL